MKSLLYILLLSSSFAWTWPTTTAQFTPGVALLVGTLEARFAALISQVGLAGPLVNAVAFNNPVTIPTNNTLPLPSLEDAQYYMYFSGAVYCHGSPLLTSWSCEYCQATGPDVSLVTTLYNSTTQVAGMININHAKKLIIVTFRGSYAAQNFAIDLVILPVPFAGVKEDVLVHKGFLLLMNSIYGQLRSNLLPLAVQYPDYKFVFGGHSLGSSLATLSLLKLITVEPELIGQGARFALFSYAGPRNGNVAFAQWANSLGFAAARITHYADLVPHIFPPTTVYTHFGTEYWIDELDGNRTRICASNVTEDPTCSNSLAPVYDVSQHFWYYGVSYFKCLEEDPVTAALQIA